MKSFDIKVVAINKTFYDGKCVQLILPSIDGQYGIIADHANTMLAITEGDIRIQLEDESWITGVCGRGHAIVSDGVVSVIVDTVEKPEEIDRIRAEEALNRAMERMRQKQSVMEYHHSKANISRALARINAAKKYTGDIDK